MEASHPIDDGALESDDSRAYRECERSVMAMLATRYADLDPDRRRDLYHEARASVLKRRRRGEPVGSLRSYLLGAADKAASKRVYGADARRRSSVDPASGRLRTVPDPGAQPEEEVLAADEARRLRLLIQELHESEAAVVKLRIDEGLEPAEIRERLGWSERQYRRQAQRAAEALAAEFRAFDRGDWARRKRSLLSACVMGIASERQQAKAAELVAEDPLCRAMMTELRQAAQRVAAALPLPVAAALPADHAGWAARVVDVAGVARDRVGSGRALRHRVMDVVTETKHQAVNAYVRTADPTPLAGARPGAAAAVLAGCLAAGGGAYCAVQGVPHGVRAPFEAQGPPRRPASASLPHAHSSARAAAQPSSPGPVAAPVAPTTPSSSPPDPQASPAPAPVQTTPSIPPPPSDQEFEPSSISGSSQSSGSAPTSGGLGTSRPATPAPASDGGSGEFAP